MRVSLIFIVIALMFVLVPINAYADTTDDINDAVREGLDNLDMSDVDSVAPQGLFDSVIDKVLSIISGDMDYADSYYQYVLQLFSDNVIRFLPSMVSLFAVAVLTSLVSRGNGLITKSTGNVAYFVGFVVLMSSIATMLYQLFGSVYDMLASVGALVDVTTPIVLTLMIANGANVTAKVYQPTVLMLSGSVLKLVNTVVLPLCSVGMVFGVCSNISDSVKVGKVSSTLNSMSSWSLGIMFMLFFSFLTVQGITATSIDGVSIRAAKFATKNYIPLLGGYLADGFELVVASTTLIKNSFGLVSMLILFAMALAPLVNVLLAKFGLMIISSIGEPILDERFVKLFSNISSSLTFLAIIIVAVVFMCLLVIMLSIMTANGV